MGGGGYPGMAVWAWGIRPYKAGVPWGYPRKKSKKLRYYFEVLVF